MILSKEFIKYCLVGVVNTLVGISTAYICLNPLKQSYVTSTIAAYLLGILVSFFLNKHFTFKFAEGNSFVLFLKFAGSMLPCYLISYYVLGILLSKLLFMFLPIYNLLEQFFYLFGVEHNKIFDNFSIIISMCIYLIFGFSLNKFFVFKKTNTSIPQ